MSDLPEGIENLIPGSVIEKAYGDVAAPALREVGKAAADVVKTARLLTAPFQLLAAFQDRFSRAIERMRARVPEAQRQEASAEVVGPALEKMRYLEEDSPLWGMFEEVLTQSIDSNGAHRIHPSFTHIIAQLSRDEAILLAHLQVSDLKVVDRLKNYPEERVFRDLFVEMTEVPENEFWQPKKTNLYYLHLEALGLASWPVERQEPIVDAAGVQTGVRRYSRIELTEFGRLFADACIPPGGFARRVNGA